MLEHFRDQERRDDFYALLPRARGAVRDPLARPELRPFIADLDELTRIYQIVRANYDPGVPVDKSLYRKTAELVSQRTHTGQVRETGPVYELDAPTLEQLAQQDRPDTLKVFNLLKALHDLVADQANQQPFLIPIGDRAEQIAQAFQERQLTTQEALAQLENLVHEYGEADQARQATNLSAEGFAFFWFLKRQNAPDADTAAQQIASAFATLPHWRTSADQERQLRLAIYRPFIKAKIPDRTEVVDRLLRMLRQVAP